MSSPVASVLVASAQSVSLVYVIGAVGALAVNFPKNAPLLPAPLVGKVARFGFHCLVLPLIYGTIAKSVSVDSIGDYWFVLVSAFVIISISYACATVVGYCLWIHKRFPIEFDVLRISASFPNIVSLPILIFPSLCEYQVAYEGYFTGDEGAPDDEKYSQCVDRSNTMIFCYFFSWSFLFWSIGHQELISAANRNSNHGFRQEDDDDDDERQRQENHEDCMAILCNTSKQTFASPGFIAMILGFITACIPPLQNALFSPGGVIRFLGAAAEALGRASSPISTMVVAASLVPKGRPDADDADAEAEHGGSALLRSSALNPTGVCDEQCSHQEPSDTENGSEGAVEADKSGSTGDAGGPSEEASRLQESPIMSDPNFGPLQPHRRSSIARFRRALQSRSRMIVTSFRQQASGGTSARKMGALHFWFTLSKLILSPALICGLIVGLECSSASSNRASSS